MNGGRYQNGCAGAVWWSNGKPAWSYCLNRDGRFPWWKACCEWKNHKCAPKPLSYEIVKQKFDSMEQKFGSMEQAMEQKFAALEQRHVDLEKQVFRSRMLINMLLDNAPKALNNLEKISAALGGDPDFANTMNGRLQSLENQKTAQSGPATIEGSPAVENPRIKALEDDLKKIKDDLKKSLFFWKFRELVTYY